MTSVSLGIKLNAYDPNPGQNSQSKQKATFFYPVRLAAKGHSPYGAQHPVESLHGSYLHGWFTRTIHTIIVSMA